MRQRLPDRRPNATIKIRYSGYSYHVTVGFEAEGGKVREVFVHGSKIGSDMDFLLDDLCVVASLLFQSGIGPIELLPSLGLVDDQPISLVAMIIQTAGNLETKRHPEE